MRQSNFTALAAVLMLSAASAARAGDAAALNILGFSTDGGIFAFEEYGEQDGSGWAYANRFYIDTRTDTFLPGTPIRVRLEDETGTQEQARQAARAKGEAIVADAELQAHQGYTAAFNPIAELSADPFRIVAASSAVYPQHTLEYRLEEIEMQAPPSCEGFGAIKGYRLTSIDAGPGGVTRLIHEDKSIPAGRNCPLGYRLGGVQVYFDDGGQGTAMVLLTVRSIGFEGPDYRWLAVSTRIAN